MNDWIGSQAGSEVGMNKPFPGSGFWGWLGRQVGYVKKAAQTPVAGPRVVHRSNRVEEAVLPDKPNVKLRRTVIDEVIVDQKGKK